MSYRTLNINRGAYGSARSPEVYEEGHTDASSFHTPAQALPALSLDVLRTILYFLPVHIRLQVVTLVCKRWRGAALSTITRHPKGMTLRGAVRLLPALQHVRICDEDDLLVQLPNTVRSIYVTDVYGSELLVVWTNLTALDCVEIGDSHVGKVIALNHATLTKLRADPLPKGFADFAFPALTDLRSPLDSPIMAASRQSLTALDLDDATWFEEIDTDEFGVWPRVHTLHLSFEDTPSDKIFAHFPALTALHARLNSADPDAPLPFGIRSALTALTLHTATDIPASFFVPSLRHLTTSSWEESSIRCTSLTRLDITMSYPARIDLAALPALRKLVLDVAFRPYLDTLPYIHALEQFSSILEAPTLPTVVHFCLTEIDAGNLSQEINEKFLEMLLQAEARGMQRLAVPDEDIWRPLLRAARRRLTRLFVYMALELE